MKGGMGAGVATGGCTLLALPALALVVRPLLPQLLPAADVAAVDTDVAAADNTDDDTDDDDDGS